jgi:hypothetical protein
LAGLLPILPPLPSQHTNAGDRRVAHIFATKSVVAHLASVSVPNSEHVAPPLRWRPLLRRTIKADATAVQKVYNSHRVAVTVNTLMKRKATSGGFV